MHLQSSDMKTIPPHAEAGFKSGGTTSTLILKHSSALPTTPQGSTSGIPDAVNAELSADVENSLDVASDEATNYLTSLTLYSGSTHLPLDVGGCADFAVGPRLEPLTSLTAVGSADDEQWKNVFSYGLPSETGSNSNLQSLGSNSDILTDWSDELLLMSAPASPEPIVWDYRAPLPADAGAFTAALTAAPSYGIAGSAMRSLSDPLISSRPTLALTPSATAILRTTTPVSLTVIPSQVESPPVMRIRRAAVADPPSVIKPLANPQSSRASSTPFVQFDAPKPDGPTQQEIEAAKAARAAKKRPTVPVSRPSTRRITRQGEARREPWMDLRPNPILMDRQIQILSFASNNKARIRLMDLPSEATNKKKKKKKKVVRRARRTTTPRRTAKQATERIKRAASKP